MIRHVGIDFWMETMMVVGTYRLGVVWALLAMSEELLELDCYYYYQVKTHLHHETLATWGEV